MQSTRCNGQALMRILVLSDGWPPYATGGAEVIAEGLAREYEDAGHEVGVVTTVRSGADREALEASNPRLAVHAIATRYPKLLRPYLGLRNPASEGSLVSILRRVRPDVVHAHNVHRYLGYHSLQVGVSPLCIVMFLLASRLTS